MEEQMEVDPTDDMPGTSSDSAIRSDVNGDNPEENFNVEHILDKHTSSDGKTYYLLKWKGFDKRENSWEPIEHLNCAALIAEFERTYNPKKKQKKLRKLARKKLGFARGLPPEKILGVTNNTPGGELFYLMKWFGVNKHDIVPAWEARERAPRVVLEYFEEHFMCKKSPTCEKLSVPILDYKDLKTKTNITITSLTLDINDKIAFVCKWDGLSEPEVVRYDQAKKEIPLVIIDFFQPKIRWHPKDKPGDLVR